MPASRLVEILRPVQSLLIIIVSQMIDAQKTDSNSKNLMLNPKPYKTLTPHLWHCVQVCRQLSEGSRRATHFYELDVQVKGYETLEKSLVCYPVPLKPKC